MSQRPSLDHEAMQRLLPWYAAGTLEAAEHAQVEAHLATCPDCRAEIALDRALAAAPFPPAPSPDAGWAALAARLEDASAAVPPPVTASRRDRRPWERRSASGPARWRWLAAAQFAVIAVFGTWLLVPSTSPLPMRGGAYRALGGDGGEGGGNVLAMFRPNATEAELRGLLTASSARVVNGPTSAGAYVLSVPGGADGPALARLRRNRAVTMAEPIGGALP